MTRICLGCFFVIISNGGFFFLFSQSGTSQFNLYVPAPGFSSADGKLIDYCWIIQLLSLWIHIFISICFCCISGVITTQVEEAMSHCDRIEAHNFACKTKARRCRFALTWSQRRFPRKNWFNESQFYRWSRFSVTHVTQKYFLAILMSSSLLMSSLHKLLLFLTSSLVHYTCVERVLPFRIVHFRVSEFSSETWVTSLHSVSN
jgi:hypothetical protein